MKTKTLLIATTTLLMAIVSCKKEKIEENNPPKSDVENPVGGESNHVGFMVCAGGTGNTGNNYITFDKLDSIVLEKVDEITYQVLNKITVLPSDFTTTQNLLNFNSLNVNQNVLSQLGNINYATDKIIMSIYLSVPLNYIHTQVGNNKTNRRFEITKVHPNYSSPCNDITSWNAVLGRVSVGDDANRCKLVGIN